jgi:transcription antitermination factor NusG
MPAEIEGGEIDRSWYAVYTAPQHEKKVSQHFQVRGIESFLPLCRTVHRWKNRCTREIEIPLFPGYIFARVARHERVRVLAVPNVVSIVGTKRQPIALETSLIDRLRSGLAVRKAEPHPYVVVGERARIREGAFSGLEGVVVRYKDGLRVVISLELIMRSIAVEVDATDIEGV